MKQAKKTGREPNSPTLGLTPGARGTVTPAPPRAKDLSRPALRPTSVTRGHSALDQISEMPDRRESPPRANEVVLWSLFPSYRPGEFKPISELIRKSADQEKPLADLKRLLTQPTKNVVPQMGPPVGDTLVFCQSWNGRLVAVTTTQAQKPARVFIQEKTSEGSFWTELKLPPGNVLPKQGLNATIVNNELILSGGFSDGKPNTLTFTYDLNRGREKQWTDSSWRTAMAPQEIQVAWSSIAPFEADADYSSRTAWHFGGASGYTQSDRIDQRGQTHYFRGNVGRGAPLPWETTGGAAIGLSDPNIGQAVLIGPGSSFDGTLKVIPLSGPFRAWAHCTERLIGQGLGLGQLAMIGNQLIYYGGFKKLSSGKIIPNTDVLRFDHAPEAYQEKWKLVCTSPFASGTTRLIERNGKWVAVMVSDKNSAVFPLEK